MLNHFVNFVNSKLGLKGDLLEVMNESFSWSSGKANLLRCAGLITIPLFQQLIFSRYRDICDAPYVAINGHTIDGFHGKLLRYGLLRIADHALDTVGSIFSYQLLQAIKERVSDKFTDRQFPPDDDGTVHAQSGKIFNLPDMHVTVSKGISKLYMNATVTGAYKFIDLTLCLYRIHQKSSALSHLLPPPLNSRYGLPLSILAGLTATSCLLHYTSKFTSDKHATVHDARDDLHDLSIEVTDEKARNVISNKISGFINAQIKKINRTIRDVTEESDFFEELNGFVTNSTSIAKELFAFATIGSAVIQSNYASQNFYSILHDITKLGRHIDNFLFLIFVSKDFAKCRDRLQEDFEKLATTMVTVTEQKALITHSDDAALSIKQISVRIPDKGPISIEELKIEPGEICALVGGSGEGKTTIFDAIQTGKGLVVDEGGFLTRAPDSKLYVTTQNQDIDRVQTNTLLEKLQGGNITIERSKIEAQLKALGFDSLLYKLEVGKCVETLKHLQSKQQYSDKEVQDAIKQTLDLDITLNSEDIIERLGERLSDSLIATKFANVDVVEAFLTDLTLALDNKHEEKSANYTNPLKIYKYLLENNIKLSGGQRKACTLLRAVNSGANLILLDEPFSGIDTVLGKDKLFRKFIKNEAETKGTSFLITDHTNLAEDLEARSLYNRVYEIKGNAVIKDTAGISR